MGDLYDELSGGETDLYSELDQQAPEQPVDRADYHAKLRETLNHPAHGMKGVSAGNPSAGVPEAAEYASAVNEIMMAVPDTVVNALQVAAGGWEGLYKIVSGQGLDAAADAARQGQDFTDTTTPSDVIESATGHRPGQGGFMEPGLARDSVRLAGNLTGAAMGMKPVVGRNIASPGGATAELTGFGSAAPVGAAGQADQLPDVIGKKQARKLALQRGSGDVEAAGFRLNDAGDAVKDVSQKRAISAGVAEKEVARIASTTKATRARMKEMVDVLKKGRKNARFGEDNPPNIVAGDALKSRLKIIRGANKAAGRALEREAKNLKGKPVAYHEAINKFTASLEDMDIVVDAKTGKLDFSNSLFEGDSNEIKASRSFLTHVFNRFHKTRVPDAWDVHRAKRVIDEIVTFGKTEGGLKGTAKNAVKALRHDLSEALKAKFPGYRSANETYSETIDLLGDIQSMAGGRVDLMDDSADLALGTMSRKILSNYAVKVPMRNLFSKMDEVARKYSPDDKFLDDVNDLVGFEAELRRLFPDAVLPNTLQGNMAMETARDAARGDMIDAAEKLIRSATKKTDDDVIEALEAILSD